MKAIDRRVRALETSAVQATQQREQAQQQACAAFDHTLHRLKDISTRLADVPTREHSPAEAVSWLLHHTGEQGQTAGLEAIKAVLQVIKQPAHSQQDLYDSIQAVAERRGVAWPGLTNG